MSILRQIIIAFVSLLVLFGTVAWWQFNQSSEDSVGKPLLSENDSQDSISGNDRTARTFSSPVKIPFTLTAANNISVRVIINGSETMDLMFHTAVDSISITEAAAKKIHLPLTESVNVQSWGGVASSQMSTGNSMRIGDLEWPDLPIFVDELSGPGTDGKFGPNLFSDKILEINFDNHELVVHSSLPRAIFEASPVYHRLDFEKKLESMYVTGELMIGDQKLANQFMVHSGFGGTLLLDDQFVQTNDLASKLETTSERELTNSFGNVLKTRKVKISSFDFGGSHFEDVPVEIFDGAIGRQKVSVVGGDFLKRFNMLIDAANHHIYLSPSALFDAEFSG